MKYRFYDVEFSKNPVATGEEYTISVSIITWDWLKKNISSWSNVKSRFEKWGDLIG